jgi:hypothetical protein
LRNDQQPNSYRHPTQSPFALHCDHLQNSESTPKKRRHYMS